MWYLPLLAIMGICQVPHVVFINISNNAIICVRRTVAVGLLLLGQPPPVPQSCISVAGGGGRWSVVFAD